MCSIFTATEPPGEFYNILILGSQHQYIVIYWNNLVWGLLKFPQVIAMCSQGGKRLGGRHFMLTAACPLSLVLTKPPSGKHKILSQKAEF